jgi:hypothetical protein
MKLILVAVLALAAGPGWAALPDPPPPPQPRQYEPPKAQVEEDPACVAVVVQPKEPNANILLRNVCEIRVNFALCVRRSDDERPTLTRGSLSPAAVYDQDVPFTPKTRNFTHRSSFCAGVTCEVEEPDC